MYGGKRGFTVVELLIVIVVIAILAAITVIAFNGVRDRARAASITTELTQADKKLRAYSVDNNELYPNALSDAGVSGTGSVTYSYNRGTGGKGFCLAATSNDITYYVTNNSKPMSGECVVASTAIVPSGGTSPPGEDVLKAFDGNLGSKWLVFNTSLAVAFSVVSPASPSSYVITSGNDYASRDPLNWTFEGSNDRVNWTVLDTRSDQIFSARNFSRTFSAVSPEQYEHFKFNVSQNTGAAETQLSEIQIPGSTIRQ